MAPKSLEDEVIEFASELTETTLGTFKFSDVRPEFQAVKSPTGGNSSSRIAVHSEPRALPVSISGRPALEVTLEFRCRWDHKEKYLAVERSSWAVRPLGVTEPLFRVEFIRDMSSQDVPCAHVHVHAHRDEMLYSLMLADKGRPRSRSRVVVGDSSGSPPRLADVHFPTGGARMRPAVEDLYSMLIAEFAVDTVDGWQWVIDQGRQRWRQHQIGASVRDAPEVAARVLAELGYVIEAPEGGHPDVREKNLRRY